jgi:hypothetical protein
MRRLLLLPLGLLVLTGSGKVISQQAIDFRTGPAPTVSPLPVGAVPEAPRSDQPISALAPNLLQTQPESPAPAPPTPTPYPLPADAGPWCICAAHYSGPDALDLARQVVEELRNKHRLPAYVFNHAEQARKRFEEEQKNQQKLYPHLPPRRRVMRLTEQCAVLVTGFNDFDSASAYLSVVKGLPMPPLTLPRGLNSATGVGANHAPLPYDTVTEYERAADGRMVPKKRTPVSPFAMAMVVHNPLVPLPPKPVSKFDPFWTELNSDEEYSLLRCSRPWTLVVKEYSGSCVVPSHGGKSSGFLNVLGLGNEKPGERLSAAGAQAHELARVLRDRRLGFDAYVLHTRTASIVTIGGFNSLDDPELQRMQQRLQALKFRTAAGGNDPIGLMARAVPMEVPRP